MKYILFIFVNLISVQVYASYSCSLIKDSNSCEFMPPCEYNRDQELCLGTIERLPRFIDEFQKETQHVFTVEQILSSSKDLFEFAKNRKKLAQLILKYKISDTWILSNPTLGVIDFRTLEKTLHENNLTMDNLKDYPSFAMLLINEDGLKKLSYDLKVPVLTLLKAKLDVIMAILPYQEKVKDLLNAGLSIEEILNLKTNYFFWMETKNLKKLLSLVSLDELKNLSSGPSHIFWSLDAVEKCMQEDKSIFPWLLKVNKYVTCGNFLEISKIFHIPFSQFTTKKEDIEYLSKTYVESFKEFKNLGFELDQILKGKFPNINESQSVQKIHSTYGVSIVDAISYSNGWANSTKAEAMTYAQRIGQPLSYVLKMNPYHFKSEESLAAMRDFKIPEKYIPYSFTYSNLKLLKEVIDYCIHESSVEYLMKIDEYSLRKISGSRKDFELFKRNWEKYKKYFTLNKFITSWNPDFDSLGKELITLILNMGDINDLKNLENLENLLVTKIRRDDLPLTYASEMGYEDVYNFIKSHTPKTIRYTTKNGTQVSTECSHSWDRGLNPFLSNPYAMKCNPDEPIPLLYKKELAEFIESQGRFWLRSNFEYAHLSNGGSLKSALTDYKGNDYKEMGNFSSLHRDKVFPYADTRQDQDMAEKLNAINYGLLLMNKFNGEIVIYRSQKCDKGEDWITKPFRLWSTTTNAEFARKWKGNCILEIHLPKGYPLFFLNIASKINVGESEFLLPSYVLDEHGKLVPAEYEIIKEEKNRTFESKQYDSVHDIEFQYWFKQDSFLIKPASHLMHFKGGTEKEFAEYQKHYVDLLCSPEKIFTVDNSLQYLKNLCDLAKRTY